MAISKEKNTLSLDDVLRSVEHSYPSLELARQDRVIADSKLLANQGAFDTSLNAKGEARPLGYYKNGWYDIYLEQPTSLWGINFFSGWRLGLGRFATYEGKSETNSLGEFRTGFEIPLLKDGFIDRKRTNIAQSEIKQTEADLKIFQKRIEAFQAASQKYWKWVGSGKTYYILKEIMKIAIDRDKNLEQSARLGQIPMVESLENKRAIFQRQSSLISAERNVWLSANELSIYYRDKDGVPLQPDLTELPNNITEKVELELPDIKKDLKRAINNNPELKLINTSIEQLKLEYKLLDNQKLPEINLAIALSQDIGTGDKSREPFVFDASLKLKAPIQLRTATGKIQETEAALNQLKTREEFLKSQINIELNNSFYSITAAINQYKIATEELKLAKKLEQAEKEKFRLGDSSLLFINIREQASADAKIREVTSVISYYQALTDYKTALSEF